MHFYCKLDNNQKKNHILLSFISENSVVVFCCSCPGGFLCSGAAGWQLVPAVGYGLRDYKSEGNPDEGQ